MCFRFTGVLVIRFSQFIIYSLLLHALLIVLSLVIPESADDDFARRPTSEPIRVRITQSKNARPTAAPNPIIAKDAVTPKKIKSVASEQFKAGRVVIAKPEPEKPTYSDLFPQQGPTLPEGSEAEYGSTMSGSESHDPEADGFSFDHKAKNISRLERFAKELSQHISIPSALKDLEPSGKAFLRFSRKDDSWSIVSVSGDPYYRALLYEVLSNLSRHSHAFHLLSESDYDSVRIYLSFSTSSSLDQTVKPLETKTDANKVYIAFTHQEAGAAWQMAAPQVDDEGRASVGLNILGVGLMAYKAIKNDDPSEDIEAKKLRLSPAFSRPIGRR